MDETHAPDELMRRARRFRRLAMATLLLTACSVEGFIGAVCADVVPLWKAATGSACSLSFAAYIAADARREYWLRRWLGSLSRR